MAHVVRRAHIGVSSRAYDLCSRLSPGAAGGPDRNAGESPAAGPALSMERLTRIELA